MVYILVVLAYLVVIMYGSRLVCNNELLLNGSSLYERRADLFVNLSSEMINGVEIAKS